ncbi:hypothetical protein JTB14_004023 [Gonioctena quinquepunctata]|nr:hypothetical protein JTB14_004023 [Gonioctena quinquepunctata]
MVEWGFSLEEAFEMAYGVEYVTAINIEPPTAGVLTDQESGEKDSGGFLDNLSGLQLRAAAEIRLGNNERIYSKRKLMMGLLI